MRPLEWFVVAAAAVGILLLVVSFELVVYRECLRVHPWWYCLVGR